MNGQMRGLKKGGRRTQLLAGTAIIAAFMVGLLLPNGSASVASAIDAKVEAAKDPKKKPLAWYTSYPQALTESRKANKRMILAYFCGTDWDEWTKKLDAEVLTTDLFKEWAEKNVILLKIDFPKTKPLSSALQEQYDKLRHKYNIIKVPTLLFLDCDGLLVARVGYDSASLRDTEEKGKPETWMKYADEIVKNPPPPEVLIEQKDFKAAVDYSKKKFIPLLAVITKGKVPTAMKAKAELLGAQPFIRFANHNMVFAQVDWPDDLDKTEGAVAFRQFVVENKIGPAPFQIIVWDFYDRNEIRMRDRIFAFTSQNMDDLIDRLDKQVPTPDYSGQWLEDYKYAQFTSTRMKKPLLICFTSLDSSEYCQKFEEEVFKTEEFKAYARKNLVLLRVDFPKNGNQSDALKEQNKQLADMFVVRGYPFVIIFNPLGQRIGDSKYMKGGAEPFIKQLNALVRADRFSRP